MAEVGLIPYDIIEAASDITMAWEIERSGSRSQNAVDARVRPVVLVALQDNPTIAAAAANAAAAAVTDAGMIIGLPTSALSQTSANDLLTSWTTKTLNDPYVDLYTDGYTGTWVNGSPVKGTIPILDSSGRIRQVHLPSGVVLADGSVPFNEVLIGDAVRLRQVTGARGARLEYTSRVFGEENRPYLEVNAAAWDYRGDVTAGYQIHVTGNGSTPNSGQRVYWFVEAHGLGHTQNGDPKYEGWYGMGVANREVIDERGMGRAFLIGAGGRGALGFPFEQPYVELMKNTAFMADDRSRPAWGNGVGQNHVAQTPGTLHSGDLINFRREGHLGLRFLSVGNVADEASRLFMSRARGTVTAPEYVQAGDSLGGLDAGTVAGIFGDYVHVNNAGSGTNNRKRVTARVDAVATETFTPGTAEGTRIDVQVTPNGKATRVTGLGIAEAAAANETSILIRVNKAGTITQTRVEIGAADSGGNGYRALRIPN